MLYRHGFRVLLSCLAALAPAGSTALPAPDPSSGGDYASLVRRAREELARNDLSSGLGLLDQAVRANPEGEEALALLGHAYLGLNQYPQAAAALRRASTLADRPDGGLGPRVTVRSDLAVALARQERSDEAIGVLREILAISPERPTIHHDIARILLAIGSLEKAEAEFRKEIEIQTSKGGPPDAALGMSYEGLGVAAYRLGDDATALAAFEKRARLPGDALTVEGRYGFGLVLARLGRHEEAAAAFRDVLGRDPGHRGALQNLARSDIPLGLKEERGKSLERFQDLYSDEVERKSRRVRVRDLRAEARRRVETNDFDGAVTALNEAARLSPDDDEIQIEMGRYQGRAGDRRGSEETLRRVLGKNPLNAEAHYQLGRLLADAGEVASALTSFERAAQIEPMALNYRTSLAQSYLRMHRNDEGVRELRLAQTLDPDDPEAAFNLGLGLAQAGSLQEAAGELESAVRMGYKKPVIHQVLSQIYAGMGDARRAAEEKAAFESQSGSERPRP